MSNDSMVNTSIPIKKQRKSRRWPFVIGGIALTIGGIAYYSGAIYAWNYGEEVPTAVLTFVCLTAAALAGLFGAATHCSPTQDDINTTLRLVANVFVVITSLVLGLMLNSAENKFETNNRNVHALATDLILLVWVLRRTKSAGI
jgi:uncharacterized membrane protein